MRIVYFLLLMGILIGGLFGCSNDDNTATATPIPSLTKIPELVDMEEGMDIKVTERGVKYIVDPEKLIGGGPSKDGIPSIDSPRFVTVAEADEWIADNELVLAMIYKGVKRVYPLQIMVWHEIVNDTIAGDPILITY